MRKPMGVSLASWIRGLEQDGRLYAFYKSPEWRELRARVIEQAHGECERCRERGAYSRAVTVHHVNEVKDRPDLALSMWYTDERGERRRNLLALCNRCHNDVHGRTLRGREPKKDEWGDEWW